MVVHEKEKKKIAWHFLITDLKDLCCYAFYGLSLLPSDVSGTCECAASKVVLFKGRCIYG